MTRKQQVSRKKLAGARKRTAEDVNEGIASAVPVAAVQADASDLSDAAGMAVFATGPVALADPVAVVDPIIVIEIDPVVSGGYVHGRFDVMIRGRAVSAAPDRGDQAAGR